MRTGGSTATVTVATTGRGDNPSGRRDITLTVGPLTTHPLTAGSLAGHPLTVTALEV